MDNKLNDALDRLEKAGLELWPPLKREWLETVATVREALEQLREERDAAHRTAAVECERAEAAEAEVRQLREERDGWEKIAESRALYAHKQAARMGAHASAPQPTPVSGVPLAATGKASEGAEDGTGIDTRYRGRAEAAEAENRWLTEGLRERDEIIDCLLQRGHFDPFVPLAAFRKIVPKGAYSVETYDEEKEWLARIEARALLSANPPQGDAAKGSSPPDGGAAPPPPDPKLERHLDNQLHQIPPDGGGAK